MDPLARVVQAERRLSFPRTRGDGLQVRTAPLVCRARTFPHARAGMDPGAGVRSRPVRPQFQPARAGMDPCVTPTVLQPERVSPARAGMDPDLTRPPPSDTWGFPRTRGDGPGSTAALWPFRGRRVSPARAGMDPRGTLDHGRGLVWVSPARAGMDPRLRNVALASLMTAFPPHARGWTAGKQEQVEIENESFPRTRGDGPVQSCPRPGGCS